MKEFTPKVNHDGEPITKAVPGYYEVEFPYYDFDIRLRIEDEWQVVPDPDTSLTIYRDQKDVTHDYMYMGDSPGFIRPTLYNLKQVLSLLDENMDVEMDKEIMDGETVSVKEGD